MKETKTKKLFYKRAVFNDPSVTLAAGFKKSLGELTTVGVRREPLAPEGESPIWRVICDFDVSTDFAFGVLVRYIPGQSPAYVVDDELAARLTVEQIAAPVNDQGQRRELLDGMLYFGVLDNHLVMMQSASLRSDHLETHLQWMLRRAGVISHEVSLQLVDQLPVESRERLAKSPVKDLVLGGDLLPVALSGSESEEGGATSGQSTVSIGASDKSSKIWDAIRDFIAPDVAARLDVDALANSNIEYKLKITYSRTTTRDGQKLMNTLGAALRHADGVNAAVHLKKGGVLKGNDLKLSGPIRLRTWHGMPEASEVNEAMQGWLLDKLKSGDVEP